MVDENSASWNRVKGWLRQADRLVTSPVIDSASATALLDFPCHLTPCIDGPLRLKAIERLPYLRVAATRLDGEVLSPTPLENVLELVSDQFDRMTDRRNVHPGDYSARGIRAYSRAGPALRITRFAPFEDDDGGRISEFATLSAERRRPFPAVLDHTEEGWLDDEPTRPARHSNRIGFLEFCRATRVPNHRRDHR